MAMELNQVDRDALRAAQHKVNSRFVIGNIVEHKTQNPKTYKQSSKLAQSSKASNSTSNDHQMPKIEYKSEYLNGELKYPSLTSIDEDQEPDLPQDFKDIQSNIWLNIDQVEFDKLEWMSEKADKLYQEKIKKNTRFDRDGRATLPSSDNDTDAAIGHDINGLISLLDSAYQPQVSYALNVVSKIASLATMGVYDGALSENILSVLIRNCLLRVRRHIDSKNETICQSAIICMRSILCNTRVDEVMLDRIHPIISDTLNPNLWLRTDEEAARDFDIELKDSECVEIDAILALIHRTDIIKRFFYLLEVKRGTMKGTYHECILDILIRIARHSPGVCQLMDEKDNLKRLISLFLPTAITTQNSRTRPLSVKALKFIRLIAHTQSGLNQHETDQTCNIPEEIIPVIESYYHIDCYSYKHKDAEQLFKLYIETLRVMKVLCKLKRFRGSIISIMSLARDKLLSNIRIIASLRATKEIKSMMSIDWQFASHLIDLIGMFVRLERYHSTKSNREPLWFLEVGPIFMKWLADVIRERYIPHIDVSIALATAAHHYRNHVDDNNIEKMLDIMLNSETTKRVDGTNSSRDFFRLLVKKSCENSQFRGFITENGKQRDPKELPSFGCLSFATAMRHKLNPLFDIDNAHILLNMFIHHLQNSKSRTVRTLSIFIDNIELIRYIKATTSYFDLPLSYETMVRQSLFAQYEVEMIARCLILLGKYYIGEISEFDSMESESTDTIKYTSSTDFKFKKKECYSNLCYYTISMIGLLCSESDVPLDLKDQLFGQILFNRKFHSFTSEEHFRKTYRHSTAQDTAHQWNFALGSRIEHNPEFWLLKPIYMNQKQCDRFWMLRPLTDYYRAQTEDPNWHVKQKSGNWFERTLCDGVLIGKDVEVVAAILELNYLVMIYSPVYFQFIVKPNIEEQLVSIGTIFLNDDIFLDESVSELLSKNLSLILDRCTIKPDLEMPFKNANKILRSLNMPLADFFNNLIEQFESVSYGNNAFSNFLLLFITPQSDKMFRKMLFQEKLETCLGQIRSSLDDLCIPHPLFFSQKEEDPEIRALIARAKSFVFQSLFLDTYCTFHGS